MIEANAIEICQWRYDSPYDVYNYEPYDYSKNNLSLVNPEVRQKEFYSVYGDDTLIGHFCIKEMDDYYSFAIGMKPQQCGKHQSSHVMPVIMSFIQTMELNKPLTLIVREFNTRAMKAYEKAGFKK